MYSTLLLEFSEEIAKITLNRPDKRNAINTQMIADLQTALDTIEKSHSRVVIVTGAGKAFCAGMDLEMLAAITKQSPAENQDDARRIAKMLRRIWSFPRPMIAAVNGAAYAGGCGIATLCDFTLAVPDAKFGYTEGKIGFLPCGRDRHAWVFSWRAAASSSPNGTPCAVWGHPCCSVGQVRWEWRCKGRASSRPPRRTSGTLRLTF